MNETPKASFARGFFTAIGFMAAVAIVAGSLYLGRVAYREYDPKYSKELQEEADRKSEFGR